MSSILQDLRYALRQLRHAPGFALTAILVLALGIGANSAVYTVLDGILLRPLPYAHPERIAYVEGKGARDFMGVSFANLQQLHDAAGAKIETGATFNVPNVSVVGPAGRFQVERTQVTANLLQMTGVQPILGRVFRPEESEPGRTDVVVLSEEAWRKIYNSDRQVVGKTLTIKDHAYTIIGVMPKGVSFPFSKDMQAWTPQPISAAQRTLMTGKDALIVDDLFVRVPEGMSFQQLASRFNTAQVQIAKQVPSGDVVTHFEVTGYQDSLNQKARKPLLLLYGVVIGIWALACLNVTSLMLARAVARTREQAVRAALGASRWRLLQQTILESLLLSGMGSFLGLLMGQVLLRLLNRQLGHSLPMSNAVHFDGRVLLFLLGLTLLTAAITGIFPALRAMRRDVREAMQGVTTTASASQNRTREALVIAQLALTLVFLTGAGLFLRTIHALRQQPLGFTQMNVLTGGVILNAGSYQLEDLEGQQNDPNLVSTKYLPLLERVRAIPGVQSAALSSVLPLRAEFSVGIVGSLDHKEAPQEILPQFAGRLASAGLVDALGIPMIRGRFFSESDGPGAPPVVVVNQAFASQFLPGQDPIGHIFGMGKGPFSEMHIVGVIGDVKQKKVTDATKPEMYFCLAQMVPGTPLYGIAQAFMQVAIRGAVPADSLRAQFDKALHEVAPDATTTNVKTIHEAVEDSFGSQTLIAHLLESFAALALVIASVGLYGLLSFAVAQRKREIGLRIALGAPQNNILKLVMRRATILASIGLALGGVLAWFAVRLAHSYLFGVQPHDGLTFAGVALVLATSALLAAWLPARRAASTDPMEALRSE